MKKKKNDTQKQYFTGVVRDIKDGASLDISGDPGIVEFSEELSDGGERDEIIQEQVEEGRN